MKPANSLATDKRHSKRLITSLAVIVLAVMSLLAYLIWSGYREAKHEAATKTRNYAAIIEGRLEATLRRADADLQKLARTIPVAALSRQAVPRYARELDARLDSHLVNFPELAALWIFDADGDGLYTTSSDTTPRTHISDRNYFRLLRDNPQAGLVFSEVLISRSRGRPGMVAARALRDEQGVFRGIVFATIEFDYFQKLFQSLDLGAHGVVSMYRSDDFTPVLRWPIVEDKLNIPLPPGNPARAALPQGVKKATIEFSSATDGMVRIYSFRVLDRYPFFVTAGLASEDVLAGWRARALGVGLSGLLLLGLLAGLLYWLWRAEAALKANEELMRSTFEQAAVGIAHIAPGTYRILMANDKFCDLLGYTRDELIGTDSRRLTPPDDMPAREAERAQVVTGKIKTSSSERRLIRKDGATLWINRNLSLVRDLAGQPQYFISVIEDITERKRAEEVRAYLSAIVAGSNDAIISRSLDDKILSWNAGAERLLGYTADEAIGQSISMIFPPGHEEEIARNRALLAQGIAVIDLETERLAKGGQRVAVSLSQSPIKDEHGVVAGVALIFRDITERKRAEQQLVALNAELEAKVAARTEELAIALEAATESDRLKSEFMANVTHELRTPLNLVIGFAGLLKDEVPGPLNAKQAAFAADILASGERLLALVEGILEMSRLDTAEAALEREPVEIGAALEERVAAHRKAAEARGITMRLEVAPDAGSAELAPNALRRIFDALLDNAIKFNREGGAVAVRARRDDGWLEIAVADTGPGIPHENLAKLFKPLTQLDAGLARRHGGLGLGLALARRLAELHGGTIEVASEPGKGSTFTLRLPVQETS